MAVYIVVPVFNEAPVLQEVLAELQPFYPHIVAVDDGSADASFQILKSLPITALRHLVNRGQGAAIQTGITCALQKGADIIVTFDSDGQHDPRDIEKLVEPIQEKKVDVTLGSRFLQNESNIPWKRRLLLWGGILFTRFTTGLPVTDTHNGLRAFSREAASKIRFQMDRMAHASELFEILRREKLRYQEIPVSIRYTSYSLHKGQQAGDFLRILWSLAERSLFR